MSIVVAMLHSVLFYSFISSLSCNLTRISDILGFVSMSTEFFINVVFVNEVVV